LNADFVRLDNLHIETIIGVLPSERTEPQPLVVGLELELDLSRAALNSDLNDTIDYAQLASEVAFILQAGRFKLLESAALALCHYLLTPPIGKAQTVAAAKVNLSKPMALAGRAIPSVSMRRSSDQVTISDELHGEATVQRIYETDELTLLRLQHWPRGNTWPPTRPFTTSQTFLITPELRLLVLN
jgi:dihydroneopterin aldolase